MTFNVEMLKSQTHPRHFLSELCNIKEICKQPSGQVPLAQLQQLAELLHLRKPKKKWFAAEGKNST